MKSSQLRFVPARQTLSERPGKWCMLLKPSTSSILPAASSSDRDENASPTRVGMQERRLTLRRKSWFRHANSARQTLHHVRSARSGLPITTPGTLTKRSSRFCSDQRSTGSGQCPADELERLMLEHANRTTTGGRFSFPWATWLLAWRETFLQNSFCVGPSSTGFTPTTTIRRAHEA